MSWRTRQFLHIVGCWGCCIIQFGGQQSEDDDTLEVLDPGMGTVITSPVRLPGPLDSLYGCAALVTSPPTQR